MPPLNNPNIISSSLENPETSNVSIQILDTKFGKPEDIIEAHVYDKNNNLLDSYPNVKNNDNVVHNRINLLEKSQANMDKKLSDLLELMKMKNNNNVTTNSDDNDIIERSYSVFYSLNNSCFIY